MRLFVQRSESVLKSTSSYSIIAETGYIARSAHMFNLRNQVGWGGVWCGLVDGVGWGAVRCGAVRCLG